MILEVEYATFAYESSENSVFEDIRLGVEPGEILCILGPNGVGKTSLLKCIAGLLPLRGGKILCGGRDLVKLTRIQIARMLAYVPQIHYPVFAYTVFETVLMGRTPYLGFFSFPKSADERLAYDAIDTLGIRHLSAKPYTEISGGERQLVMFARALAQEPQLIVLDEPTAHLDYGNQVKVLALIRRLSRRGTAVIMTSHNPDHAFMVADRVAVMYDGTIMDRGLPQAVITEDLLFTIYGIQVRLQDDPTFGKICIPSLGNFEDGSEFYH
jgi:iron complex transport system ATP-binding protein